MLGALIGAGASLLGGLFGQSSQEKQIQKQIDAQKEFAQQGIRWRVDDANAAGIHPLYALGANTHSFSPIGIGGSPLGEGIAAAGQEFGRAVQAKGTQAERLFNQKIMQLQLQRGELENQLLASQIARINTPSQMPPAMPQVGMSPAERFGITGQADKYVMPVPERFGGTIPGTGQVLNVPLERIWDPSAPWREPGAVADSGFARTASGGLAPVPSADFNDRAEDVFGPDLAWTWRNQILPNFVDDPAKKPPAPAGYRYEWSIFDQAYVLVKD